MTINLPNELESSVRAEVASGHFASVDEAMAEAVRLLLQQRKTGNAPRLAQVDDQPDTLLGSMSDHAELMDEIVEDAMRNREHQPRHRFSLVIPPDRKTELDTEFFPPPEFFRGKQN